MQNIPVIDLQAFREGGLPAIDQDALVEACEDHGFFLLTNHGCDAQISRVFEAAAEFFCHAKRAKKRRSIATRKIRWATTTVS